MKPAGIGEYKSRGSTTEPRETPTFIGWIEKHGPAKENDQEGTE